MQVGRSLFMLWALQRHDAGNFRNFLRITSGSSWPALFWIAGAFARATRVWRFGRSPVGIEYLIAGGRLLGAGPRPLDARRIGTIDGGASRRALRLFIIIALGESILVTGATFADMAWNRRRSRPSSWPSSAASPCGRSISISAPSGPAAIATSDDPGRLAAAAIPMSTCCLVAGIIVAAVADELVLAHPAAMSRQDRSAVIVGGPALYLIGNAIFKRLSAPYVPLSHLVGLVLLALLVPAAAVATPLSLSAGSTAILILVAVWEGLSLRHRAD